MSTIQEQLLEDAAALRLDVQLLHEYVHGGPNDTWTNEQGQQPSVAMHRAQIEASYSQSGILAEVAAKLDEARDWASKAEDDPVTSGPGGDLHSAFHWAVKAQASAQFLTYTPFGFRREGRNLIVESGGDSFDSSLYIASILLPGSSVFSINHATGYLEASNQL